MAQRRPAWQAVFFFAGKTKGLAPSSPFVPIGLARNLRNIVLVPNSPLTYLFTSVNILI